MTAPETFSLADLAAESGVPVPCAGNLPLDMGDPQSIWFIEKGTVDLFLIECQDGVEQSAQQHLLRADSGRFLPSVPPLAGITTLRLIAKGLPGTMLRCLPVASMSAVQNSELAEHVDAWVMDVSARLSRDIIPRSQPDAYIEPGRTLIVGDSMISTRQGVAWVSAPSPGAGLFLSLIDPTEYEQEDGAASDVIPLTPVSWLTILREAQLSARSSETLAEEGLLLPALANFNTVALSLEQLNRSLAFADQANLERERAANRRSDEERARRRLFNLYGMLDEEGDGAAGDATLHEVLRIVGRHEGIDFKWPARRNDSDSAPVLGDVMDASGVRARQVRLNPDDRWWIGDSGAMLAFQADNGQPVALLPGMFGQYRVVDPTGRRNTRVTAKRAESLRTDAWLFYQPLTSSSAGPRNLFQLIKNRLATDFLRFAVPGLLSGLVMLVPAVVLGFIVDKVIPTGEAGLLYLATALLAAFALIGALLHIQQGMALMRLEGRAASRIEAAFWDRLLRLPLGFLRRYPAGDLAMRGMTFQNLRDEVSAVVVNAVLSIIFLLPAFFLIFFYDVALGSVAAAFGLLSLIVTVALGLQQISPHGRVIRAAHHLAGQLFQLINGISKLRVDGAEGTAFAVLARNYREQKQAELELGGFEEHLQAFSAALPFFAGAVLFLAVTLLDRETVSIGDFLVVYLVFMVFQTAVARLGASFSAVAAIMPAFNQVQPFLAELPESGIEGEPVRNLGGEIVFDHVTFQYDPDGPLILDDVSIRAYPGEFIAITGESGTGKSTLFRLALGLNQPTAGAVYYDGRDLEHLNIKQVRRKIGVVPQNVELLPEDVWDNIVGDREEANP